MIAQRLLGVSFALFTPKVAVEAYVRSHTQTHHPMRRLYQNIRTLEKQHPAYGYSYSSVGRQNLTTMEEIYQLKKETWHSHVWNAKRIQRDGNYGSTRCCPEVRIRLCEEFTSSRVKQLSTRHIT